MILASLCSGGKDSIFSAYLATQMGHEIACLVSIRPREGSWLFHTPNVDMVPLMAESMGVPLTTIESDGSEDGDMESLKDALKGLDVEGVVVGAIWSDYQWDRINLVCGSLGLKVIAPMWRKGQGMLFEEIVSSGIKAMIVGCFAEGLDKGHLGRMLDQHLLDELKKLEVRYGISVMGEGGEYETLVLDSPMFKRPIDIVESEIEWNRNHGTLNMLRAELKPR